MKYSVGTRFINYDVDFRYVKSLELVSPSKNGHWTCKAIFQNGKETISDFDIYNLDLNIFTPEYPKEDNFNKLYLTLKS